MKVEQIGGTTLYIGSALESLRSMPAASVQTCVTSPPYWGLRDYGVEGQIGLEPTPELYVERIVEVFREIKRVLRDDGTLWVNLGDSYAASGKGPGDYCYSGDSPRKDNPHRIPPAGLKPKDLVGIPWRVAFALQADGWYLRSDIIWAKPNPMPESVTDRPTKSHEYIFLLAKSERYYYDAEAIREECSSSTHARISQNLAAQIGSYRANGGGKTNGPMKAVIAGSTRKLAEMGSGIKTNSSFESSCVLKVERRNKRTVWEIASEPYSGAHFATYPRKLVEPCILAGSRGGDTVLDPFGGSGTTAAVALSLGRRAVLCELNPEYADLIRERVTSEEAYYQPRLIEETRPEPKQSELAL